MFQPPNFSYKPQNKVQNFISITITTIIFSITQFFLTQTAKILPNHSNFLSLAAIITGFSMNYSNIFEIIIKNKSIVKF